MILGIFKKNGSIGLIEKLLTFLTQKSEAETSKRVDNF
jgi:hypothetical protein